MRGELSEAARRADAALQALSEPVARARAARVLAAVLAHRGLLARSAELHRWAATIDPAAPHPAAMVAWIGTGALPAPDTTRAGQGPDDRTGDGPAEDGNDDPLEGPADLRPVAAPTMRGGADALAARGLQASVQGSSSAALADLVRAAAILEATGTPTLHDDTPAALGALVALHRGEPEMGRLLLDRAIESELGGVPALRRHRLLRAWTHMAEGHDTRARAELIETLEHPGARHARDELLAVGLEAALARRAGDTGHQLMFWARARAAVLRHPVDLYALLPLGELAVVAARLGHSVWLAQHTSAAEQLLAALSTPPLWAAPWHWTGVLAAITEDNHEAAIHHAQHLAALADTEPRAALLARGASCWIEVRAGHIDPTTVADVARALHAGGLAWEAARLAKDAAVRTTDRKAVSSLLNCARSLHHEPPPPAPLTPPPVEPPDDPTAEPGPDPTPPANDTPPSPLSAREREIAELLLNGLTYREIGSQLYITAKTVEHHVKRIRQRLGSQSRSELFRDLQTALNPAA